MNQKSRDELKILLLQIREDETTMLEEFYEFVQYAQLREEQITKLNTYERENFPPEVIDGYDALFVGGSSDASVLKPDDFQFVHDCKTLLRHCYDKHIPVLASCFGFQLAVEELGGKVILDKDNIEMGIHDITLTDRAKDDPLLFDCSPVFPAVSGHKERAASIPEDAIVLGYTEICPYHIIKFVNKPFYGFQFHPEVDRKDLITRITRYQNRYLDNADSLQAIIDGATCETTEANDLVAKFIDRIILRS